MQTQIRSLIGFAAGAWLVFGPASTAVSSGTSVLLTVEDPSSGIERGPTDADLLALPQRSFETSTLWTAVPHEFSGPTLKSVLESVGVSDGSISLHAYDNYSVSFPVHLITDDTPIIANRMDGAPFSIRAKGPLWVVFPFDQDAAYQSEYINSLSVWQLYKIRLVDE